MVMYVGLERKKAREAAKGQKTGGSEVRKFIRKYQVARLCLSLKRDMSV